MSNKPKKTPQKDKKSPKLTKPSKSSKPSTNSTNSAWESTISEKHYTPCGFHPEDRIFKDKEYAQRLRAHIDNVFNSLVKDLKLNTTGENWLFDFFFNEERELEFEEYLIQNRIEYKSLIK